MKINIIRNDLRRLAGIAIMLLGLVFLGTDFFKEKITSKSDLKYFKVKLQDPPFERKFLRRSLSRYMYYLHFEGFPSYKFRIEGEFAQYFYNQKFERLAEKNDSLTIFISQNDFRKINDRRRISLFGITQGRYTFLDYNDTINQYNNMVDYYSGIACLIIASLLFFNLRNK